jgi:hypothetical protein
MATMTTQIGPVGTRQINRSLFVGQSDLATIQIAVNVAASIGGFFVVVIPMGYAGTETISSITGGSPNIQLSDQRYGQWQTYEWLGGQFIPGRFQQGTGFVSLGIPPAIPPGSTAFYFDPNGTTGIGTGHLGITANTGQPGIPSLNIDGISADGSQRFTYCRFELTDGSAGSWPPGVVPELEAPVQLGLFNGGFDGFNLWTGGFYVPGNKGMYVWARADEDAIDLQGYTIGAAYDQTIRLNYLGGSVQIGPITFDADGNIIGINNLATASLTTSSLTADDADFDTCEVNSSPVRTFANTPDGPGQGMVWPPDGIPVSLGNHWQAPSIDPTSLATWPAAGIAVSTGTAWGTPIAAASLATWPATGVPVSTGTAWGTSINPATLAHFPAAGIPVSTGAAWGTSLAAASLATWPAAGIAVSTGSAWGTPIAAANVALLNQANVFTQAITTGILTVNGSMTTSGAAVHGGGVSCTGFPSNTTGVCNFGFAGDITYLDSFGAAGGRGNFRFRVASTGAANLINALIIDSSGNSTFYATVSVGTQLSVGTGGITTTGGCTATTGFFTSGAKAFQIVHPLDETKVLTHASLEGPELGVYYRGEGVTEGGWAEITLPDYFEALVRETDRTVLLTALFEDDAEQIGMLAASRVKDGKFKVWSALGAQKFYWEVKGVRGDIDPLVVEEGDSKPSKILSRREEEPYE